MERPLTLFLIGVEIVTISTIGDTRATSQFAIYFIRTCCGPKTGSSASTTMKSWRQCIDPHRSRNQFETAEEKTLTSGCAQGAVFGDLMEKFEAVGL